MRFGFHFRHRRVRGPGPHPAVHALADGYEGHRYRIVSNPDRQSREMGFFPGMEVRVMRNVGGEHGLVIGVGSTRYVVARTAATAMRVESAGAHLDA